jgi:hypothetical protein
LEKLEASGLATIYEKDMGEESGVYGSRRWAFLMADGLSEGKIHIGAGRYPEFNAENS